MTKLEFISREKLMGYINLNKLTIFIFPLLQKTNSSISFSKENSTATQIYNRIKDAMDNNYEEKPNAF